MGREKNLRTASIARTHYLAHRYGRRTFWSTWGIWIAVPLLVVGMPFWPLWVGFLNWLLRDLRPVFWIVGFGGSVVLGLVFTLQQGAKKLGLRRLPRLYLTEWIVVVLSAGVATGWLLQSSWWAQSRPEGFWGWCVLIGLQATYILCAACMASCFGVRRQQSSAAHTGSRLSETILASALAAMVVGLFVFLLQNLDGQVLCAGVLGMSLLAVLLSKHERAPKKRRPRSGLLRPGLAKAAGQVAPTRRRVPSKHRALPRAPRFPAGAAFYRRF